jgi:hypothetical protein
MNKTSMTRALLALSMLLLPLRGQDVDDILKRNREAEKRNDERAKQYTFVEEADYFEYDKKGQTKKTHSDRHDVIFVEGESYKRLVARDGRPLAPRGDAKEQKKLQQTAEQRRKERRSGLFTRNVSLSGEDLMKYCDHRLMGEEETSGHKAWVVEFTPQPGRVPTNQHEKDVLSFQTKVWIDEAEYQTLKMNILVVGDGNFMKPGSIMMYELAKINEDAWLPVSFVLDARIQIAFVMRDSIRTEYKYSNFQKFDVQSTITVGDR